MPKPPTSIVAQSSLASNSISQHTTCRPHQKIMYNTLKDHGMNIHIGFVKFSLVDVLRPAFTCRCTAGRADKYTLVRAMYAPLSRPCSPQHSMSHRCIVLGRPVPCAMRGQLAFFLVPEASWLGLATPCAVFKPRLRSQSLVHFPSSPSMSVRSEDAESTIRSPSQLQCSFSAHRNVVETVS